MVITTSNRHVFYDGVLKRIIENETEKYDDLQQKNNTLAADLHVYFLVRQRARELHSLKAAEIIVQKVFNNEKIEFDDIEDFACQMVSGVMKNIITQYTIKYKNKGQSQQELANNLFEKLVETAKKNKLEGMSVEDIEWI